MSTTTVDWREHYEQMRAAAVPMNDQPIYKAMVRKCQINPWLKVGGMDFEPDGVCCEHDYPYYLERYDDVSMLERFFEHGNWGLRAAVTHRDLIFVNQVNGGDEWWTVKILPSGELMPFESITFGPSIERGGFVALIERLASATPETCKALTY
jgi:hypothetical protein